MNIKFRNSFTKIFSLRKLRTTSSSKYMNVKTILRRQRTG